MPINLTRSSARIVSTTHVRHDAGRLFVANLKPATVDVAIVPCRAVHLHPVGNGAEPTPRWRRLYPGRRRSYARVDLIYPRPVAPRSPWFLPLDATDAERQVDHRAVVATRL